MPAQIFRVAAGRQPHPSIGPRIRQKFPVAWGASGNGIPNFQSPKFYGRFAISGVTRNSTGTALAGCTVDLFQYDGTRQFLQTTTSDGSGNYSFSLGNNAGFFFIVAYLAGSPDVAGTTVHSLAAV